MSYQPRTDQVPDGYSHALLEDGKVRVTYETWRSADTQALCDFAERRMDELVDGGWNESERKGTSE